MFFFRSFVLLFLFVLAINTFAHLHFLVIEKRGSFFLQGLPFGRFPPWLPGASSSSCRVRFPVLIWSEGRLKRLTRPELNGVLAVRERKEEELKRAKTTPWKSAFWWGLRIHMLLIPKHSLVIDSD